MNLAAYRNYKTTEAPWLGDVPSHWEVRRLRTVLRLRNEKNSPVKTEQILSLSIARGVTLYSHQGRGGNKRKGDITAYKIAHAGDIVLNSMNVIVGAVGLSRYTGAISPVYYALFPATDEVDIKYYDKVFGNTAFQRYLLIYGKGILIKKSNTGKLNTIRMKISPDDLKGTLLPIPPIEEQQQIACFLDWKTAQINRFIRNKRRLIELLKEQKQNVINQAMTRGLDPNVKLKPSGVEWIGDIPEHWEVRAVGQLFSLGRGRVISNHEIGDNPGPYPVFSSQTENQGIMGRINTFMFDGDFLTWTTDGAKAGTVFLRSGKFNCTNVCGTLKPRTPISLSFVRHALNLGTSYYVRFDINPKLMNNVMARIRIPLPDLDEQFAVADYIDSEIATIDQTITRAQREIELMREYRTRLISDVVTGQVDVRGIEVPEVAPDGLLPLEEDTADADDVIDDEGDMDETD